MIPVPRVHKARANLLLSALGLCLILSLLTSCGDSKTNAQPTPTPSGPQYVTVNLGIPQKALDAPIVGTVPDDQILHVGVTFKMNQDTLNKIGQDQTAKHGQGTSASSIANQLGISDETYQKIKDFFGVQNATLKLGKTHTNLTIDAKAKTFAELLQTKFVVHKLDNRTYYTPDPKQPPKLPKFVMDTIVAITGLDNYSLPPEHHNVVVPQASNQQHSRQAADCTADARSVIPSEVAHAYGYDQFWKAGWHGENMTINLVEIDGFDTGDIQNYFDCVGFKGKLDVVNVDGPAPQPGGENTLDLEMIAGLAPAVHIIDYQTDLSGGQSFSDYWTQINDELQQIINDNADNTNSAGIVSISLGLAEEYMTEANIDAVSQSIQQLTQVEHMTVFVASGDCAAFTNHVYNQLSVSFPASNPWSVAVGGTNLNVNNNGSRSGEVVWSDGSDLSKCHNQWGSGGGLSQVFKIAQWQNAPGTNNKYSNGARQIPDISAVAFDLAVYYQGQWIPVGGTSAAAPIWAAGLTLVNQGLIDKKNVFIYGPRTFYYVQDHRGSSQPYYDVTRGDNLYYPATSDWDYATGLGTPNLVDFYQILLKSV